MNHDFIQHGFSVMHRKFGNNATENLAKFCGWFGVDPQTCHTVWSFLQQLDWTDDNRVELKHLFWALLFLRCYWKEEDNANVMGCCRTTFRMKVWHMLSGIAKIYSNIVSTESIAIVKLFL